MFQAGEETRTGAKVMISESAPDGVDAVFTFAIDLFINISKLAFVITDNGEEFANLLVSTSPRGVTIFNARGAYTGNDVIMLMCALKVKEIPEFQRKVLESDSKCFYNFFRITTDCG